VSEEGVARPQLRQIQGIARGGADGGVDPCRQIFLVELFLIGVVDRFNLPIGRRVVRPMLTMLRSLEVRQESSPQKYPRRSARTASPELYEALSGMLMNMDGEQSSENSFAAGGLSQGSESWVAKPLQLEATAPPDAPDEAAEKGSLTTRVHDKGQTRAVASQFVESSGEPKKISSAGAIGGDGQATNASVAIASSLAPAADPLRDALAALDRRDYATAQRLFETCGRKDAAAAIEGAWAALDRRDYATAQRLFESLSQTSVTGSKVRESGPAIPAAPKVATSGAEWKVASDRRATPSPIEIIPLVDPARRQSLCPAEKRAPWRKTPLLLASGLLIFAICGAYAIYGSALNWSFPAAKSQAMAGLALAINAFKAPLGAITRPTEHDEERSAIRAVSAALTRLTTHLDQIEHDYGARLDRVGERLDQDSYSRFADVEARVGKLEQKGAAPAASAAEFTDLAARLDKLEKRVVAAAQPASEITDIATRLDKLEKRATAAASPSSAKPLLSAGQKQSTLMARAEPSASIQRARPNSPTPLLQNYSVEDVRDGIAVVDSRFGSQQVAPGDFIPGAGRVLRIERRGEDWIVLTSLGIT
jgi:tetrahydromethanopterin S-methyltransferase subunit G